MLSKISLCLIFFIILITMFTILILLNLDFYNKLNKDEYIACEYLLTFLFYISFSILCFTTFVLHENCNMIIPLFILIFVFEVIWVILFYNRYFEYSIYLSLLIIFSSLFYSSILSISNKDLFICSIPFFIFSLYQFCISNNIYLNNIGIKEIN